LKGLSPKANREVPPLRYEVVTRLKQDFPDLVIVLNGGLTSLEQCAQELAGVDGVMLGREPYHHPWLLASVDSALFGLSDTAKDRFELLDPLIAYTQRHVLAGGRVRDVTRHVLGLFNGFPGARRWRQCLSDASELAKNDPMLIARAAQQLSAREALTTKFG
ncbi:MAG: tRNA-dihydrouridine synthase, partial [Quisquiliibacterium sp.]